MPQISFFACSLLALCALSVLTSISALAQPRWSLQPDGGIHWNVVPANAHEDHIEMSGRKVSIIITYGVDAEGKLVLSKLLAFPTLRTLPNNTHGTLQTTFGSEVEPQITLDGVVAAETVTAFEQHGLMTVQSELGNGEIGLTRLIFPSTTRPLALEKLTFTNRSKKSVVVGLVGGEKELRTDPKKGLQGAYVVTQTLLDKAPQTVEAGASATFSIAYAARPETQQSLAVDVAVEERLRRERIASFGDEIQLQTPDPVLNASFSFAKIRALESIYETRGGLMHSPGGGRYYAAIWANDQAEYANPFFGFVGDEPRANRR